MQLAFNYIEHILCHEGDKDLNIKTVT